MIKNVDEHVSSFIMGIGLGVGTITTFVESQYSIDGGVMGWVVATAIAFTMLATLNILHLRVEIYKNHTKKLLSLSKDIIESNRQLLEEKMDAQKEQHRLEELLVRPEIEARKTRDL